MTAETQPSFYKQVLHKVVKLATNNNDLMSILQSIPLEQIKCFVNQQIEELDTKKCKNAYFHSLSINQIFPDDIMQLILSFDGLYHTKSVNKKWKELSDKNEQIEIIKTNKSINNTPSNEPKYDIQTNKTWIIHPFRKTLHRKEIDLGYIGPINDIQNAINQCQSGDRLLIHDGMYNINDCLFIDQNVQIMGVGNNVIIKDTETSADCNEILSFCYIGEWKGATSCTAYFENITFDCSDSRYITGGCIQIADNNKLLMNNVKLKFSLLGVAIHKNAYLEAKNCEFIGKYDALSGMAIFPTAKEVNVENCIFKHCGKGSTFYDGEEGSCILLYDCNNKVHATTNIDEFVKLKCIGNVFENNFCYPIAERHEPNGYHANDTFIIDKTDRYLLKDNVLRGYNATKVKKLIDVIDANRIYYNDELAKDEETDSETISSSNSD